MANQSPLAPTIFVIFGITGDLSQRYLLPALYHLFQDDLLGEQTEIIGITRRDVTAEELFDQVELCVNEIDQTCDPVALKAMHQHTRMLQMDLNDPAAYRQLLQTLNTIEEDKGVCMNRLYYLSIPPQVYQPIVQQLGAAGLNASCQHGQATTRLLIEKPFGYDLVSAQELIAETGSVFPEEQVFRIDHFLAKEAAQDILRFRFQYPALDTIWNTQYIERIEIAASEQIGIEGRVRFYEPLGALRDFIQNHLLQLLAVTTMERPAELTSTVVHSSKQALLAELLAVPADQVTDRAVRGQYRGYLEEVQNDRSTTETYADVTLYSGAERWHNVPMRLWTGKKLDRKQSYATVYFRAGGSLRFHIQPDVKLELTDGASLPSELQSAVADFHSTADARPNAYERVLADAVQGDQTLFASSSEVLDCWRVVQPVLNEWAKQSADIRTYEPGTAGPLSQEPA